ncbi:MAG: hypothetical protein IH860_09200 [Chloroflexi bacterium]|nr:hypothetical protein [Chloroflexota bacterium]
MNALKPWFAAWDRGMYGWADDGSGSGHVRRVDIFKVRDGKVTENLCYGKG